MGDSFLLNLKKKASILSDSFKSIRKASNTPYLVKGSLSKSDEIFTLFYHGRKEVAETISSFFFNDVKEQEEFTPDIQAMENINIRCRDNHSWTEARENEICFLLLVESEIQTETTFADYIGARIGKKLRRQIKKIDEEGFTIRNSRDERDYKLFYEKLWKVSGDSQFTSSYEGFDKFARGTDLILMEFEGRLVGGSLCIVSKIEGSVRIWKMCYNPECFEDRELKSNVNVGLDAAALRMADSLGLKKVSFGRTPGILNHGIYFYKTKWGCQHVRPYNYPSLLVSLKADSAFQVIKARPLLTWFQGEVCGLVAHDFESDGSSKELATKLKQYRFWDRMKFIVYLKRGTENQLDYEALNKLIPNNEIITRLI